MNATTTATTFPSLANWATYYSNGKNSYDTTQDGIKYSIAPVFTDGGKLRGYSLTCFGWPNMQGHANILASPTGQVSVHSFIGHKPSFSRASSAAKAAREAHAKHATK